MRNISFKIEKIKNSTLPIYNIISILLSSLFVTVSLIVFGNKVIEDRLGFEIPLYLAFVLIILSLIAFYFTQDKERRLIEKNYSTSLKNKLSIKEEEFPFTRASLALSESTRHILDNVRVLKFIMDLVFGWLIIFIPIKMISFAYNVIINSESIEFTGEIFIQSFLVLLIFNIGALINGTYRKVKEIEIINSKLKTFDVSVFDE